MLKFQALNDKTLRQYSPVTLAYIGDAVFELMVRSLLVLGDRRKIKDVHLDVVARVKASSQARLVRGLFEDLSPEEQELVRWGRNAKNPVPRHADPGDYRMSTGFETLLGYLYLNGNRDRIDYLVSKALETEFWNESEKPLDNGEEESE
ncbi:MAG TPA: ribonuclease III domain-containing protein [Syntrophomonadaceae bacterium]|nr:ribonuclease III domain-containing protein [Syntrophomonadaceae bacterium]